jgi:hypothetical protein
MRNGNSAEGNKVMPRGKDSHIYKFRKENWTITEFTLKNAFANEA